MNRRQQFVLARRQHRDLAAENEHLRREVERVQRECHELEDANLNLRLEVTTADELFGSAMNMLIAKGIQ